MVEVLHQILNPIKGHMIKIENFLNKVGEIFIFFYIIYIIGEKFREKKTFDYS